MVNLECCLGGQEPLPKDGPNLKGDPASPAALKKAGFDFAVLANNHIADFQAAGVRETLEACRAAGLAASGAGMNLEEAFRPWLGEYGGVRVGVLSVCDREDGEASLFDAGTACIFDVMVHERLRALRAKCDLLILVVHGGREYVPVPPVYWRDKVLALAACGADMVIGHHPHVPQGMTLLKRDRGPDVPVFFSIGNFVFRPAALNPGLIPPFTDMGFAVRADFIGASLQKVDLLPYRILGSKGPRAVANEELEDLARFYTALSEPLVDAKQVSDWFDAVCDHFWEREVRERVGELTRKFYEGDREAMCHAINHHQSYAHHTLITRAMQRILLGQAGQTPPDIREKLQGWFQGQWPMRKSPVISG